MGLPVEHYGTPLPRVFVEDLLRIAESTDRLDEVSTLASGRQWIKHSKVIDMGRLVLVYFAGKAPVNVSEKIKSMRSPASVKTPPVPASEREGGSPS